MTTQTLTRMAAIRHKSDAALRQAAKDWPYALSAGVVLIGVYLGLSLLGTPRVHALTREDAPVEWAGAVAFLAATVLFIIAFARSSSGNRIGRWRTRRNLFFLALAGLTFFAFGEEIAWGQRLLNYEVPSFFLERNIQRDFTIHNLDFLVGGRDRVKDNVMEHLLTVNMMFGLFWGIFLILIPLVAVLSRRAQRLLSNAGITLLPVGVGLLFPANYLLSKVMERTLMRGVRDGVTEIKEALFGFLFSVLAVYVVRPLLVGRKARPAGAAEPQSNGMQMAAGGKESGR